jgi:hypothetical protein
MTTTKFKETQPAKPEASPQPAASVTPVDQGEPCPPDMLLELAAQEPSRRALKEYAGVIRVLRNKKQFTFREIAKWLRDHNVDANHNMVYREYTRAMPEDMARAVALAEEEEERRGEGRQ